jgi:hypothetical protein
MMDLPSGNFLHSDLETSTIFKLNHLFRLGPWLPVRKLLVYQRVYGFMSRERLWDTADMDDIVQTWEDGETQQLNAEGHILWGMV